MHNISVIVIDFIEDCCKQIIIEYWQYPHKMIKDLNSGMSFKLYHFGWCKTWTTLTRSCHVIKVELHGDYGILSMVICATNIERKCEIIIRVWAIGPNEFVR